MLVGIGVTSIAILIATLLWIYRYFTKLYYWTNENGDDSIKGTTFITFKPTLIALKDDALKKFGLYLLRFLPGPPKLIITNPQVAVKFMSKQHKYERMKDFRLGCIFKALFGKAVGSASGGDHNKRIRSVFEGCYSAASVAQATQMMERVCHDYLKMIVDEKEGLLTMDDMMQLTFRMLMKFTYGFELTEEEFDELTEVKGLVGKLMEDSFTNPFVKYPFYEYLPTKTNKILKEFETRWKRFNGRFKQRFSEGSMQDTTCVFYKLQETLNKNPGILSEDEFQQTLEEASLANVDITCGATAWLLYHVSFYQKVQKELKAEIESYAIIASDDNLSQETINKMDFLEKVVKESARKRPVLVISIPEYVKHPMVIGGFQTPPGIEVSVDNLAVNSDKDVWGNVDVFNPRRFDQETPIMRKSLCRFGIGPRRCMGYRVADTFMKVLLVSLLRNYSVTLETHVTGDDDSVPVINIGPFCYPCVTFKLRERIPA